MFYCLRLHFLQFNSTHLNNPNSESYDPSKGIFFLGEWNLAAAENLTGMVSVVLL